MNFELVLFANVDSVYPIDNSVLKHVENQFLKYIKTKSFNFFKEMWRYEIHVYPSNEVSSLIFLPPREYKKDKILTSVYYIPFGELSLKNDVSRFIEYLKEIFEIFVFRISKKKEDLTELFSNLNYELINSFKFPASEENQKVLINK